MIELHGRINRATYWEALIDSLAFILIICVGLPWFIVSQSVSAHPNRTLIYVLAAILLVAVLLWVVFFIDIIKRRANDIGTYPWLLTILTLLLPPMYIVIGCIPSFRGENKYGAVPAPGTHLKNQTA